MYFTQFYRPVDPHGKIIEFGADLMKFWQKQIKSYFNTPCT